jgi:enolase
MLVKKIEARKILCSNKKETIEVKVNGIRASCPAGTSTGRNETPSFHKLGIEYSIKLVEVLAKELKFSINCFEDLEKVESTIREIFKFKDAREIGANALVALEIAILRGIAKEQGKELWQVINPEARMIPRILGNCIGGGVHANKNSPEFQEFLFSPKTSSFREAKEMNLKAYKLAEEILKEKDKGFRKEKDMENAWICYLSNEQVLEIMKEIREKLVDIEIGLDVASSSFLKGQLYSYKSGSKKNDEQIKYLSDLIQKFGLFYVEDGLHEEDFNNFTILRKIARNCLICGDDLTCTNLSRVKKAIEKGSINSLIVKANQNGSILELKKTCDMARSRGLKIIVSHRSGETNDNWLADLAFAFEADFMKAGIIGREREVKLNRMIEIEDRL